MELIVGVLPLSGSNTVALLKWMTANQDPRGGEPDRLEDFLDVLRDSNVLSSLVPNTKRRRMLTAGDVSSSRRPGKVFRDNLEQTKVTGNRFNSELCTLAMNIEYALVVLHTMLDIRANVQLRAQKLQQYLVVM